MSFHGIRKICLGGLLFILPWCGNNVLPQSLTLDKVGPQLLANPPVIGDSTIRRNCFRVLDVAFKSPTAHYNPAVKEFYDGMLENVTSDISSPSSGLAVIYKLYNHGFIVKMQDMVIAIDLIDGMPGWNPIPDKILKEIDVILVTHEHSDHYSPNLLNKVKNFGGTVIIPSEMNYGGAVKLSAGDSVIISGVKIKGYFGLHSVPMRIYEITSPTGLKIMHTGDNQTSETLPEVKDIDILLLNSWVNESDGNFSNVIGMYNCLQKLKPKLMIPGHCNELNHDPSQRYAYDSVFRLTEMDIPSDVVVMAWGEKMIYKPTAVNQVDRFTDYARIFPNPLYDKIYVLISGITASGIEIDVTDLTGKEVYSNAFTSTDAGEFLVTIDTKKMPAGVYIIKVNSPNDFSVQKIIKMNQ